MFSARALHASPLPSEAQGNVLSLPDLLPEPGRHRLHACQSSCTRSARPQLRLACLPPLAWYAAKQLPHSEPMLLAQSTILTSSSVGIIGAVEFCGDGPGARVLVYSLRACLTPQHCY